METSNKLSAKTIKSSRKQYSCNWCGERFWARQKTLCADCTSLMEDRIKINRKIAKVKKHSKKFALSDSLWLDN